VISSRIILKIQIFPLNPTGKYFLADGTRSAKKEIGCLGRVGFGGEPVMPEVCGD
jgi:hypothetical protein